MKNRTWLSGALTGCLLAGLGELFVGVAEGGGAKASSAGKAGNMNIINSQVVIDGDSALGAGSGVVVGNGRRVTRTVAVTSEFHGIDLSGLFKAEVKCGAAASVEVLMDENLQALLTATVTEGILCLRFTKPVQTKENPQLKITLPSLDLLQLSGGDTVSVTGVKGRAFRLTHEGTGEVALTGQVEDFACKVSGIGEVNAGKLSCRSADITLSGVGGVTCRPDAKLKAVLSGIGGVRCLTHPAKVEKQSTGLGDVEFVGK